MQTFRIRTRADDLRAQDRRRPRNAPRAYARRIVAALTQGEPALAIATGREADAVLYDIDALVRAELPAVNCDHGHFRDAERVRLWSIGPLPTGVAYLASQKPVAGVANFAHRELGGDSYWVPNRS